MASGALDALLSAVQIDEPGVALSVLPLLGQLLDDQECLEQAKRTAAVPDIVSIALRHAQVALKERKAVGQGAPNSRGWVGAHRANGEHTKTKDPPTRCSQREPGGAGSRPPPRCLAWGSAPGAQAATGCRRGR